MRKLIIILFWIFTIPLQAATYYVQPISENPNASNSNAGTDINYPWLTWTKAFQTPIAGDTVFFRGGTYYTEVTNGRGVLYSPSQGYGHNGTTENPICYFNYPGEVPILDCAASHPYWVVNLYYNYGVRFYGAVGYSNVSYVHVKGLQVKNVFEHGLPAVCVGFRTEYVDHVILENLVVSNIGGVCISDYFPHYLEVFNCDAHDCCDTLAPDPGGGGTGISVANLDSSDGYAYFYGCRAWNCSDQGYVGASNSPFIFENCWGYDNGALNGDGHAFKLGASYNEVRTIWKVYNCIGVYNKREGFSYNDRTATIAQEGYLYNNFAYMNNRYGFCAYNTSDTDPNEIKRTLKNNISYQNTGNIYIEAGGVYTHSNNTWDASPAVTVTSADFISLDYSQLKAVRKTDGSLPDITFGKLASTSDLIGAGVNVGLTTDGQDSLWLDPPSIGAFEYYSQESEVEPLVIFTTTVYPHKISATTGGNVYDDGGGTVDERGVCWSIDANPTIADSHTHDGAGTGIYISTITGLAETTMYNCRAYAHNEIGYAYGANVEFTTTNKSIIIYGGKIVIDKNGKIIVIE